MLPFIPTCKPAKSYASVRHMCLGSLRSVISRLTNTFAQSRVTKNSLTSVVAIDDFPAPGAPDNHNVFGSLGSESRSHSSAFCKMLVRVPSKHPLSSCDWLDGWSCFWRKASAASVALILTLDSRTTRITPECSQVLSVSEARFRTIAVWKFPLAVSRLFAYSSKFCS